MGGFCELEPDCDRSRQVPSCRREINALVAARPLDTDLLQKPCRKASLRSSGIGNRALDCSPCLRNRFLLFPGEQERTGRGQVERVLPPYVPDEIPRGGASHEPEVGRGPGFHCRPHEGAEGIHLGDRTPLPPNSRWKQSSTGGRL